MERGTWRCIIIFDRLSHEGRVNVSFLDCIGAGNNVKKVLHQKIVLLLTNR